MGVDDGVRMTYDIQDQPQPYCLPDEVTTGQTVRILIKFIKDHPEKAHSQTRVLVIESLTDAFPCKGKKK
jgi:Rap1a immunity proteins